MLNFILIFIIIIAALIIIAAALQSSKKEGMGSAIGAMGANQIIGVKKTSDLMEQITWGLLVLLFCLTFTASYVAKKSQGGSLSPNLELLQKQDLLTPSNQQQNHDVVKQADVEPTTNSQKEK
jgi:preprotein translocase subunit SecG